MKQFYLSICILFLSYLSFAHAESFVILDTVINKTNIPVTLIADKVVSLIPQKKAVKCALSLPVVATGKGEEGSESQRYEVQVQPESQAMVLPVMTLFFKRIAQWVRPQVPSLMLHAGLQTDKIYIYNWNDDGELTLQRDQNEYYMITLTLEGDDFSKSTFTVKPLL
jgi:hypothetical protein